MRVHKATGGFTLIEILIFVSIFSMVFITASSLSVFFFHNLKAGEYRLIASRYSEEIIEWLKSQKDIDWIAFTQKSNLTYCFNTTPIISWPVSGTCGGLYGLDSRYLREVTLQSIVDGYGITSQVGIAAKVQWKDGLNTYSIPINTRFSLWEQ